MSYRRCRIMCFLLALIGGLLGSPVQANAETYATFTIENAVETELYKDTNIQIVVMTGTNYVNFSTPSTPTLTNTFSDVALSSLKSGNNYQLKLPKSMGSSRIYFCYWKNTGDKLTESDMNNGSGPANSKSNKKFWGFVEPDVNASCIDMTCVNFFSLPIMITGVDNATNKNRSVGINVSAEELFDVFSNIVNSPDTWQSASASIFTNGIVKNSDGDIVRVFAPESLGLGDYVTTDTSTTPATVTPNTTLRKQFQHYLDEYIDKQCFDTERGIIKFYSKNSVKAGGITPNPTIYYAKISGTKTETNDTRVLTVYIDEECTTKYNSTAVPGLPPLKITYLKNAWSTDPTTNWHNSAMTSASSTNDSIDFGFVLQGQAGPGYSVNGGVYTANSYNDKDLQKVLLGLITDPAYQSIPVSIVRGVMHLDDGTKYWQDKNYWYGGASGLPHSDTTRLTPNSNPVNQQEWPVFYYGRALTKINTLPVYALSFTDTYNTQNDVLLTFKNDACTLKLMPLKKGSNPAKPSHNRPTPKPGYKPTPGPNPIPPNDPDNPTPGGTPGANDGNPIISGNTTNLNLEPRVVIITDPQQDYYVNKVMYDSNVVGYGVADFAPSVQTAVEIGGAGGSYNISAGNTEFSIDTNPFFDQFGSNDLFLTPGGLFLVRSGQTDTDQTAATPIEFIVKTGGPVKAIVHRSHTVGNADDNKALEGIDPTTSEVFASAEAAKTRAADAAVTYGTYYYDSAEGKYYIYAKMFSGIQLLGSESSSASSSGCELSTNGSATSLLPVFFALTILVLVAWKLRKA